MKFDDIYPSAAGFFKTSDGFAKGAGTPADCVQCGSDTQWFHRKLGLYFCSTECFAQYAPQHPDDSDD